MIHWKQKSPARCGIWAHNHQIQRHVVYRSTTTASQIKNLLLSNCPIRMWLSCIKNKVQMWLGGRTNAFDPEFPGAYLAEWLLFSHDCRLALVCSFKRVFLAMIRMTLKFHFIFSIFVGQDRHYLVLEGFDLNYQASVQSHRQSPRLVGVRRERFLCALLGTKYGVVFVTIVKNQTSIHWRSQWVDESGESHNFLRALKYLCRQVNW